MEQFDYQFKYKSLVRTILPNNQTTLQNRMAEQKREEQLREQKKKDQQQKADQELINKRKQEERERERKLREEQQRQEEIRRKEELEQINTLKGKFGNMINDLKKNDTSLDYTISGLDLRSAQIRILSKAVESNQSLRGLVLQRKNIDDDNGAIIIQNMMKNFVLERLEMEGNQLGPNSCKSLAELLRENQTIRSVDIENNNVTNNGRDTQSFIELCRALEQNNTLLSLNLTNNNLNAECGDALERLLEKNTTLIMVDVDQNKDLNIQQVRNIQEYLRRNKRAYDDERYKEFIERKKMWNELNISKDLQIQKQSKQLLQMNLNTRIETKKEEMQSKWDRELEILERLKLKDIAKLEKASKLKKKKRKGKKKK
ncbi:hypothetical protein PPERSA_07407 [Pseudocohnilembus persalinus]|uniref:Uncharacterized protein n=1 Tax=Pseudocohnilembus persalinus TaxID=266149 RepID=A0A0V0QAA3_PSEPJ|nr:hypothetical protein PPERSA_07407 [Pseudocohnilembus persalinus]|eukprot:KRW99164.1 hypothetical protein PPERSA_07407 [Pseudocohnilembus persalinus]